MGAGGKVTGSAVSFTDCSAFNHKGRRGALGITFAEMPEADKQLGCMCYGPALPVNQQ